MAFASTADVATAYEGSVPSGPEGRVQYLLDTASARLRILLPDLADRIAAAEPTDPAQPNDLAILAKDVVVQAVIRRLPGDNAQQLRSTTQQAGPFQTTQSFTVDRTGTFPDQDLDLLRGSTGEGLSPIGTLHLGRPDWYRW